MGKRRQYFELLEKHEKLKAAYKKMEADFEDLKVKSTDVLKYSEDLEEKLGEITYEYNELVTSNNKLQVEKEKHRGKNEKLKDDVKSLKKTDYALKEFFVKEHLNWHIEAGKAWRYDIINSKPERYDIPRYFNVDDLKDIDFDDGFIMCTFKHSIDDDNYREFKIPCSLYTALGGKLFTDHTELLHWSNNIRFKTASSIKKYISSQGENFSGEYGDVVIQFILGYQGTSFSTKEFLDICGFKNRESGRQYLKRLINLKIIKQVNKGTYEFIL